MSKSVFRDRHSYILLALFIICTVFYYFGELVNLFGWTALRWGIFYTVHDLHRILFLAPILYASFHYRLRGALLTDVATLLVFLPRAFLFSPYPDPTLRMTLFVVMASVISVLAALLLNDRDRQGVLTKALKQSEAQTRAILEQMYDSYSEVGLDGNFTFVNDSVCHSLGYSREELISKSYRLTVPEEDIKPLLFAFNEVYRTGVPHKGFEHRWLCKDGSMIFVESSISRRKDERGGIIGFRSISRDISERKQRDVELRESEERYHGLFTASRDAIMTLEPPTWEFTSGNPATLKMFGARDESDFLSYGPADLSPALQPDGRNSGEKAGEMINTAMLNGSNFFKWVHKRISGEEFFADVLLSRVEQDGKIYLQALVRDVTERVLMQQELEQRATHDNLTGLPNRTLLQDRFNVAASGAHRNKTRLAIMSMDLDKFKNINDTLGHDAGDQVLKTVSARITAQIRAGDTLARVGGDEFILVIGEPGQSQEATGVARRILDSFAEPLLIDGHRVELSTSIGIAIYPEDGVNLEILTRKSDAAMYYSKGHGRNRFKCFNDGDVRLGGEHRSGP